MRIRSLRIQNFRCIKDAELSFGALTALVGRNGAGKSTFLHALDIFYGPSTQVSQGDFFARDDSVDIEIAITYDDLDSEQQEVFAAYIDGGSLTVARVFSQDTSRPSGKYYGLRRQNPDFEQIKRLGGKAERRNAYNDFVNRHDSPLYSELTSVRSADQADEAMRTWEQTHPDSCQQARDDGQFFGWSSVARGRLDRFTRLILVPAVRDAAEDATEQRGSAITELMNVLVRSSLANNAEIEELKERAREDFRKILDGNASRQLARLGNDLTASLQEFVPDSRVSLQWEQIPDLSITDPQTDVRIEEDGFVSAVTRSGHGLQRAFIFAVLQQLATARTDDSEADDENGPEEEQPAAGRDQAGGPSILLAIEEPEIYQHPSRQRHFASVLRALSEDAREGQGPRTQVVYTTHSPHFVGLDRFNEIRALRKEPVRAGGPPATITHATTMNAVAKHMEKAAGSSVPFTEESFKARLQAVMTPVVNEGFFASVAVLVEGESDRSAILGMALEMGIDLDAEGIAVIPCGGKTNLDRPLLVFRNLGTPTYVVWDSDMGDKDAKPEANRRLLRMLGREESDWPSHVDEVSACFRVDLEHTLRDEIGTDIFEKIHTASRAHFGLKQGESKKNAMAMQRTVQRAADKGSMSKTLKTIVENVMSLKQQNQT